jgi:hypothetical protein
MLWLICNGTFHVYILILTIIGKLLEIFISNLKANINGYSSI